MGLIDMIKLYPPLSPDRERELLRKKDIEKSKIINISPQGSTYLSELLKNKLVEDVTDTHVLVNAQLDKHESKVREITNEDFGAIWKLLNDANNAMSELVNSNIKLVLSIAVKYPKTDRISKEDLLAAGMAGLWEGIKRFNSKLDNRLSTYAVPFINGAIVEQIWENHVVKLSPHEHRVIKEIKKAQQTLVTELQRTPTVEELIKELKKTSKLFKKMKNVTPEYILEYLGKIPRQTSFDENEEKVLLGEKPLGPTYSNFEDDNVSPPEDFKVISWNKERAQAILRATTPQERMIFEMYFGLKDGRTRTTRQIAKELGNVSHVTVGNILESFNKKVRQILNNIE